MALHRRAGNDDGNARTKTLATLVGVMIAAAVVALVLIGFNGGSSGKNDNAAAQPASAVGKQSNTPHPKTSTPVVTAPSPTASSSSVAVSKPKAPKQKSTKQNSKAKASSTTGTSAKHVTYTVKPGDNLSVIAAWFHQHGYAKLYDWNKSVIGKNPDLIYPGQKITVTGSSMTVSSN